jgi:hypothetical protein
MIGYAFCSLHFALCQFTMFIKDQQCPNNERRDRDGSLAEVNAILQ